MNLSKLEFYLIKHLNLQPSEIDNLEFYRLEYLIEHFKEYIEEEKKRNKEKEKESFNINSLKKEYGDLINNFKNLNSSSFNTNKILSEISKFK